MEETLREIENIKEIAQENGNEELIETCNILTDLYTKHYKKAKRDKTEEGFKKMLIRFYKKINIILTDEESENKILITRYRQKIEILIDKL